jgi:putative hydrolase of the HAD superfamily
MSRPTVIFDFYGTLAEARHGMPSWREMFADLGYELSDAATQRLWNGGADGIEHHEHSRSRDHYVAWQHDRLRSIIAESGVASGDDDLLFSRITGTFGARNLRAYDESAPVLTALRERGVTIAVCSNWDWDLRESIDAAGLTELVDVVVSSAWVGARKPHPRIYAVTLEELGDDADVMLFVGDTWTCDVEGPIGVGLRPLYLRREHFGPDITAPDDPDPSVLRATDLHAVLELVDA